jgi:hypothetical protein
VFPRSAPDDRADLRCADSVLQRQVALSRSRCRRAANLSNSLFGQARHAMLLPFANARAWRAPQSLLLVTAGAAHTIPVRTNDERMPVSAMAAVMNSGQPRLRFQRVVKTTASLDNLGDVFRRFRFPAQPLRDLLAGLRAMFSTAEFGTDSRPRFRGAEIAGRPSWAMSAGLQRCGNSRTPFSAVFLALLSRRDLRAAFRRPDDIDTAGLGTIEKSRFLIQVMTNPVAFPRPVFGRFEKNPTRSQSFGQEFSDPTTHRPWSLSTSMGNMARDAGCDSLASHSYIANGFWLPRIEQAVNVVHTCMFVKQTRNSYDS